MCVEVFLSYYESLFKMQFITILIVIYVLYWIVMFILVVHLHLAQLYYSLNDFKRTFYHVSECHGTLLRHYAILEEIRREGW